MIARKSKANGERRQIARLGSDLEKRLSAYAGAAAAAGIGLLALPPLAEAKIVYTPANINIPVGVPVPLDLNHDGTADFSFLNSNWGRGESGFRELLSVQAKSQSNQIWGRGNFYVSSLGRASRPLKGGWNELFAAALRPGFTVGPNKSYFQERSRGLMAMSWGSANKGTFYYGQWDGYTQHRYLGLKFVIGGQVHYGWARLAVAGRHQIQATLTGYAYETVPNKPIVTGKTKGSDVIAQEDASLGCLAQGASAIPAWRTKPVPASGH